MVPKWLGVSHPGKTQPQEVGHENEKLERRFGLENFGNTCYANSVLQALYFCKPFRESLTTFKAATGSVPSFPSTGAQQLAGTHTTAGFASRSKGTSVLGSWKGLSKEEREPTVKNESDKLGRDSAMTEDIDAVPRRPPAAADNLCNALRDLFCKINSQKKRTGVIAPSQFIQKLKRDNELFRGSMQQDAHEFLNYVLNTIADNVKEMEKQTADGRLSRVDVSRQRSALSSPVGMPKSINGGGRSTSLVAHEAAQQQYNQQQLAGAKTWVHTIFEGVLTNETKCLTCETVTNKDESFLDLSVDIEQHSSVSACLRQFLASEMLCNKNKFFCDACNSLQEADKRMKIKRLPNVLALHLKRFKYQEKLQKYVKLSYRVAFPPELRLPNMACCVEFPDRLYSLFGFVVHLGTGPYHGHYIAVVKSAGKWLIFDDTNVQEIDEAAIEKYYGDLPGMGSAYVLFYQANDLTTDDPDMKTIAPSPHSPGTSSLHAVSSSMSSTSDAGVRHGCGERESSTSSFERRTSLSSSASHGSEDLGEAASSGPPRQPSLPTTLIEQSAPDGARKGKEGGFSWFSGARKGKRRKEKKGRKKDGKRDNSDVVGSP